MAEKAELCDNVSTISFLIKEKTGDERSETVAANAFPLFLQHKSSQEIFLMKTHMTKKSKVPYDHLNQDPTVLSCIFTKISM